jgi:Bacterial extracellular solute-binding proteins, family 3
MRCASSKDTRRHRVRIAAFATVILAAVPSLAAAVSASAATLDRVRDTGKLTLGYRADARPLSYRDESGKAAGYSVARCQRIADQVKADLGLSALTVDWVPVTIEDRFLAVQQGKADLLCGADTATLTRRKEVAFSIPVFPSGIGAILRSDSAPVLRQVLSEAPPQSQPVWRGSPARTVLEKRPSLSSREQQARHGWLAGSTSSSSPRGSSLSRTMRLVCGAFSTAVLTSFSGTAPFSWTPQSEARWNMT